MDSADMAWIRLLVITFILTGAATALAQFALQLA